MAAIPRAHRGEQLIEAEQDWKYKLWTGLDQFIANLEFSELSTGLIDLSWCLDDRQRVRLEFRDCSHARFESKPNDC